MSYLKNILKRQQHFEHTYYFTQTQNKQVLLNGLELHKLSVCVSGVPLCVCVIFFELPEGKSALLEQRSELRAPDQGDACCLKMCMIQRTFT